MVNYKSTEDISGFKSFKNDETYSQNTFLLVDNIDAYEDIFDEYPFY